jgi:uncharacterized membrane protein YdbT with pleckstrin-like domain
MKDFNKIDIIWKAKPVLKPYFLKSLGVLFTYCLFIGFSYLLFYLVSISEKTNPLIFNLFSFIIALQGLYAFIKRLLEYRSLEYQISNDLILITTNLISKKTKIVKRDKIQMIEIKNSIIDRICNTNTINFYSGRLTKDNEDMVKKDLDKFESISVDSEILKLLKLI